MNGRLQIQKEQTKKQMLSLYRRIFFGREWCADRQTLLHLLRELGFGVAGGLFTCASIWFDAKPFGIALLAGAGDHTVAVTLGCVIGGITAGDSVAVMVALLLGSVKWWLRDASRRMRERGEAVSPIPKGFPVLLATFAALLCSIRLFTQEGFTWHALFSMLMNIAAAAGSSYLLAKLFEREEGDKLSFPWELLGGGFFACVTVYALRDVRFFGLSLSAGVALLFILYAAENSPSFVTVAVGFGSGIGCGVATIPAMVCAATAAVLVRRVQQDRGKQSYAITAILSAILVTLYAEGYAALTGTLPSLLAGGSAFAVWKRIKGIGKEKEKEPNEASDAENMQRTEPPKSETIALQRILREEATLAGAMEALSTTLDELCAAARQPTREQVLALCDESLEAMGLDFGSSFLRSVSIGDLQSRAADALLRRGRLVAEDLPQWVVEQCGSKLPKLLQGCNRRYGALCRELRQSDHSDIFAAGYRSAAGVLRQCSEEKKKAMLPDRERSRRAARAAAELGLQFDALTVCGRERQRLTIYGLDFHDLRVSAGAMQKAFGTACKTVFGAPDLRMEENGGQLIMESRPIFSFEAHSARRKKKGESVCGDETLSFTGEDGKLFCMLSDGMGSGSRASAAAKLCCHVTKRLAECGASPAGIAASVGELLFCRGEECASTIDLLQIEPYTGKAIFLKSGATPSFVLREKRLLKVSAATMPVGVTKEMNAESITARLQSDDLVILCSDGVLPDFDAEVWLCKLLTETDGLSIALLADMIAEKASARIGGRDDVSVLLVKLGKIS